MNRKPKSDALASVHEAIADLYSIGAVDEATMRHFNTLCLEPENFDSLPKDQRGKKNFEKATSTQNKDFACLKN